MRKAPAYRRDIYTHNPTSGSCVRENFSAGRESLIRLSSRLSEGRAAQRPLQRGESYRVAHLPQIVHDPDFYILLYQLPKQAAEFGGAIGVWAVLAT